MVINESTVTDELLRRVGAIELLDVQTVQILERWSRCQSTETLRILLMAPASEDIERLRQRVEAAWETSIVTRPLRRRINERADNRRFGGLPP